ncbi:hypothetical protein NUU61_000007 [Penicillium alfredii]|uniref:Amino acid transporter transmembrane domain-containing protein n=1 Tax=Penicillium alfredii TaxID=1506179 RepID=A0A9W9G8W6_9EURO|nr:uncharacterized protein NUU61_000007 [Penicillium alfredii]KAJ5114248.1 hypothetical protein NUU61_000007 [Penicillium alfredii]
MSAELKEAHHTGYESNPASSWSDHGEIFSKGDDQVDFCTVSWVRAAVIFLKLIFATGVLSIPSLMYELGAFPGAINVVGWGILNTYCAIIQGNFRREYPECHTIVDMAYIVGDGALKELVGLLSDSQVGDFELGYQAIGSPNFISGITASVTIFVSSAGTSAFIPVIAEMRNTKEYPKSVYLSMSLATASYLTFSLVIYAWCGKWIASPALGSAGGIVKRVAYGIALPGLIINGCLYVHIAAK